MRSLLTAVHVRVAIFVTLGLGLAPSCTPWSNPEPTREELAAAQLHNARTFLADVTSPFRREVVVIDPEGIYDQPSCIDEDPGCLYQISRKEGSPSKLLLNGTMLCDALFYRLASDMIRNDISQWVPRKPGPIESHLEQLEVPHHAATRSGVLDGVSENFHGPLYKQMSLSKPCFDEFLVEHNLDVIKYTRLMRGMDSLYKIVFVERRINNRAFQKTGTVIFDRAALAGSMEELERTHALRDMLYDDIELESLIFTQAYRFGSASDVDIPITGAMKQVLYSALNRVKGGLPAQYEDSVQEVELVFDRSHLFAGSARSTRAAREHGTLGWLKIHASSDPGQVYVSPVMVRAIFLACYDHGLLDMLKAHQSFENRAYVDDEVYLGLLESAKARYTECVTDLAYFVMGHELAHIYLDEDRRGDELIADCYGAVGAKINRNGEYGLFTEIILNGVRQGYADLLGVSQELGDELNMRKCQLDDLADVFIATWEIGEEICREREQIGPC